MFRCSFPSDVGPVLVDRHKVLQIIVNLLNNAAQAMSGLHADERLIRVEASRSAEAGLAQLSVIDRGSGIAPEDLSRIFAYGFTTKRDGHGFGLHSAALSSQEMGGRLEAFSDGLRTGATFTLTLPLAHAEAATVAA